jgi:hypothetical protein
MPSRSSDADAGAACPRWAVLRLPPVDSSPFVTAAKLLRELRAMLDEARTCGGASATPQPDEARGPAGPARPPAGKVSAPSLKTVINATGVVVPPTWAAPLSRDAAARVAEIAGCSNLEFDLERGERGDREACRTHAPDRRRVGARRQQPYGRRAAGREYLRRRARSW